jgi:hypothetical protein
LGGIYPQVTGTKLRFLDHLQKVINKVFSSYSTIYVPGCPAFQQGKAIFHRRLIVAPPAIDPLIDNIVIREALRKVTGMPAIAGYPIIRLSLIYAYPGIAFQYAGGMIEKVLHAGFTKQIAAYIFTAIVVCVYLPTLFAGEGGYIGDLGVFHRVFHLCTS